MVKMESNVNANAVSRIAEGTYIKGEIASKADIRIDGDFEGKLSSDGRIVIGETSVISGNLYAQNIDLWGKLEGDLFAKDTTSLKNNSVLVGNICTKRLVVEIGSTFNGNCKMGQDIPVQPAAEEETAFEPEA